MRTSRKTIDSFLSSKKLAMAGVSRDPKKFGYAAYKELRDKGFDVSPINPNVDLIDAATCFRSVSALPTGIDHLLVVTSKKDTLGVVQEAVQKGIKSIWIQQMSDTPESIEYAKANGVDLVTRECILLWAEPVKSIHKFHRTVKRIFGLLPR